MKGKEFEILFKELTKAQEELTKARDEVKDMKRNFDFLVFLRNEELSRLQRLVNREQFITPSELADIFGDAIRVPDDLVEVEHE